MSKIDFVFVAVIGGAIVTTAFAIILGLLYQSRKLSEDVERLHNNIDADQIAITEQLAHQAIMLGADVYSDEDGNAWWSIETEKLFPGISDVDGSSTGEIRIYTGEVKP